MKVYGRPAAMDADCNAFKDWSEFWAFLPEYSNAAAVAPYVNDQKILCGMGGSGCPFAESISVTKEPESDDVIK